MASRRRRRRTGWKRLRRVLIDHRFTAAEGVLGLLALAGGLWLLWPSSGGVAVDHRSAWQQSLHRAPVNGGSEGDAYDNPLFASAEASVSISAKRDLESMFGQPSGPSLRPRLAKIAHTMPEIGPPEALASLLMDGDGSAGGFGHGRRYAALNGLDRRDGGVPDWLRNAAVAPIGDHRPMVAVVIDDLGMNRRNTAALNRLKGPLTLAFLPYAGALEAQTQAARAAGHELLMHMPMEPIGHDWPGPDALLRSLDTAEFRRRLGRNFDSFSGFVGINNHMGSRLTRDHERMAAIMQELRARGLLFLDSKTVPHSVADEEAERYGVPFAQRDVFLDHEIDREYIMSQLGTLERLAKRNGAAVAIGHPHDVTIEALKRWLPTLEERGLALVPISTIVARRMCLDPPVLIAKACATGPDGLPIGPVAADVESRRS